MKFTALGSLAITLLISTGALASPSSEPFRTTRILTKDGLHISVQEWGNPKGPAVVLIHGLLQNHDSWIKQTTGPLAKRFHLVTYDLRGHGTSDAPPDAKYYQNGDRWAQELDAVMKTTHAKRPILVGWSMGGIVISDYLAKYGSSQIRGLVYLDSWIKAPEQKDRASAELMARMASESDEERLTARTGFLRACYWRQPTPEEFSKQLTYNMITPSKALLAMVKRSFDYDKFASKTRIPVLVYHGEHDQLMSLAAARHTARTFPRARLIIVPGVGHASFYENPEAFEKALSSFATRLR